MGLARDYGYIGVLLKIGVLHRTRPLIPELKEFPVLGIGTDKMQVAGLLQLLLVARENMIHKSEMALEIRCTMYCVDY